VPIVLVVNAAKAKRAWLEITANLALLSTPVRIAAVGKGAGMPRRAFVTSIFHRIPRPLAAIQRQRGDSAKMRPVARALANQCVKYIFDLQVFLAGIIS